MGQGLRRQECGSVAPRLIRPGRGEATLPSGVSHAIVNEIPFNDTKQNESITLRLFSHKY